MAQITASSVKSLRDRTGLPMMDCKRALQEAEGDEEAAVETLRKQGVKTQSIRQDRETTEGRFAIYTDFDAPVGVMIELRCESAPVAKHEEFDQLAQDMAKQLATGPVRRLQTSFWTSRRQVNRARRCVIRKTICSTECGKCSTWHVLSALTRPVVAMPTMPG